MDSTIASPMPVPPSVRLRAGSALKNRSKTCAILSSGIGAPLFLTVTFTHGVIPKVKINREKAARYGMNVADVQLFVSSALGGAKVGETVEGVARYPITLRYPADLRDNLEAVRNLPVLTPLKQSITLSDVAEIRVTTGAPMIKTENARLTGWVYISMQGIATWQALSPTSKKPSGVM